MVASKTSDFIPDRKTKLLPAFNRFFEISMGIFTTLLISIKPAAIKKGLGVER